MTNTTAHHEADYIAPLGTPLFCPLERIAVIANDGDGDEDYAEVVIKPNCLKSLIHAKNQLWGRNWHFQESWEVEHPDLSVLEETPEFVGMTGLMTMEAA